jgi:nucleotide-binding universal stress UspA family protein
VKVTIVAVITPVSPPRSGLLATTLAARIRADIAAHNRREREGATARLARAAESLTRAGWRVRTVLRTGAPLAELLDAVRDLRADILVVGAGSPRTLKLGRVGALAQAAVNRCPVPVLVVR